MCRPTALNQLYSSDRFFLEACRENEFRNALQGAQSPEFTPVELEAEAASRVEFTTYAHFDQHHAEEPHFLRALSFGSVVILHVLFFCALSVALGQVYLLLAAIGSIISHLER